MLVKGAAVNTGQRFAFVGVGIGVFGWMIGAVGFAAAHGAWQVVGQILPVGLTLSAALTALLIALMLLGERLLGRGSPAWFMLFWGGLLLVIGIGTLASNHWLSPLMLTDPKLAGALSNWPITHRVSDVVPIACLLMSAILLGQSIRAMPASADEPRAHQHRHGAHAEDSPADGG
jgi:hypothetical protein